MSHYQTPTGRHFVECDDAIADPVTGVLRRCGRRSYGQRERFGTGELDLFDLPRGWSVAPYSDDFDHGVTRQRWFGGALVVTPPIPTLVGIVGDLHTCPSCNRQRNWD